ncbi:MAG: 50S ribosomal protein L23 [Bacilli bacterium]|jgi:large subunit ribosomal protein L23
MADEIKKASTEEATQEKKPEAKKATKAKAVKAEAVKADKSEVKATGDYKTRPAILKDFGIIKYVIATEETQRLQSQENAMVFACDNKATKAEIKAAVQAIFSAKVKTVHTINVASKSKRVGRYVGKTASYKKAIVRFDSSFDLGKISAAVAAEDRKATPASDAKK